MSSVVARRLLVGNAALTDVVPAARIALGTISINTRLPAIGIRQVSGAPHNTVSMKEPQRALTSRVQVTVYAAAYKEQDGVLELVRRAMPNTSGVVGSIHVLSVIPDSVGPDLKNEDATIFMKSRDFKIKYIE